MQTKNLVRSIRFSRKSFHPGLAKLAAFGMGVLLFAFLSSGCKKLAAAAGNEDAQKALFEENILNRNFIVQLATDTGVDLTSEFAGYNFVLTKTDSYYNGQITGTKDGIAYSGTWTCNDDFSKLDIEITDPAPPASFKFINRPWRFAKKAFPIMELSPWGSTDPKVLHMERL